MRAPQLLLAMGLATALVIACGDDDPGTDMGDAGDAGSPGYSAGTGGTGARGGSGGTQNQGGDPNANPGGEPGVGGTPGLGGGGAGGGGADAGGADAGGADGGGPVACSEFVDFVHELFESTAEDNLPSVIPDLCPTGPGADLDAPATAFDDLL